MMLLGAPYAGQRLRKLRFLMTDNILMDALHRVLVQLAEVVAAEVVVDAIDATDWRRAMTWFQAWPMSRSISFGLSASPFSITFTASSWRATCT